MWARAVHSKGKHPLPCLQNIWELLWEVINMSLVGRKFGRWTVIAKDEMKSSKQYWLCECECGNKKPVVKYNLTSGRSKSCGCLRKETVGKNSTTHGHTSKGIISTEYNSWYSMRQRCEDPNNKEYQHYGGRGIKVCERWDKFENFLEDMGSKPYPNYSIERVDNNGDYEPFNCIWGTPEQQARNKRVRFDSQSGVRGVGISRDKYRAYISVDSKRINIGTYETIEEAAEARKQAEVKYWGKSSL